MWPWSLTLKLEGIVARGVSNLPTNCGVSGRFVLDISANTCQTRHVTLRPSSLTLEVTALVADTGLRAPSVYQVWTSQAFPFGIIFGIYYVSINPPGDLDLWPLNPKTVSVLVYPKVIPCTKFEHCGIIRFRVMLQTNKQTDKQTDSKIDQREKSINSDMFVYTERINETLVCNRQRTNNSKETYTTQHLYISNNEGNIAEFLLWLILW